MHSFFHSPSAKEQFDYLYFEKLDSLGIDYEMLLIETSYGDTNIIIGGTKGKPDLVVLHGRHSSAVFALEKVQDLLNDYRIYAIDIVGQPNLSEEIRPDKTKDAYAQWMFEILSRLSLKQVTLLGWSLGTFIIWKTLIFDNKKIRKAYLLGDDNTLVINEASIFEKIQSCWLRPHLLRKASSTGVSNSMWKLLEQEYNFDAGLYPSFPEIASIPVDTSIYLLEDQARIDKGQLDKAKLLI